MSSLELPVVPSFTLPRALLGVTALSLALSLSSCQPLAGTGLPVFGTLVPGAVAFSAPLVCKNLLVTAWQLPQYVFTSAQLGR